MEVRAYNLILTFKDNIWKDHSLKFMYDTKQDKDYMNWMASWKLSTAIPSKKVNTSIAWNGSVIMSISP